MTFQSRSGLKYEVVSVLQRDPRRPLRKQGRALGGFTKNFYRDMYLVEFRQVGATRTSRRWIEATRLRE